MEVTGDCNREVLTVIDDFEYRPHTLESGRCFETGSQNFDE